MGSESSGKARRRSPGGICSRSGIYKTDIDRALRLSGAEGKQIVREQDFSGHGTSVLGIAAGNGRASGGVNRGVAYTSDIIAVKWECPERILFQEQQS